MEGISPDPAGDQERRREQEHVTDRDQNMKRRRLPDPRDVRVSRDENGHHVSGGQEVKMDLPIVGVRKQEADDHVEDDEEPEDLQAPVHESLRKLRISDFVPG